SVRGEEIGPLAALERQFGPRISRQDCWNHGVRLLCERVGKNRSGRPIVVADLAEPAPPQGPSRADRSRTSSQGSRVRQAAEEATKYGEGPLWCQCRLLTST